MKNIYTRLALAAAVAITTAQAFAQGIPVTQTNFFGEIVPQYMASSAATQRLPVVFRARLTGLTPSATYRFFTRGLKAEDLGMSTVATGAGAGNFLYVSDAPTIFTTAPTTANADNSGSFTTDADGNYSGWFSFVSTGNDRFIAGQTVIPGIVLTNGTGGTSPAVEYALDQTVTPLTEDASPEGATGIYGTSQATAKNIVALYDNASGSGRPLSTAYVESLGVTIPTQAAWYDNVRGTAGSWGTLVPNGLPGGVQLIAQYDAGGAVVGNNVSASGTWGTTNTTSPNGGLTTPLVISTADAPLNAVTAAKRAIVKTLKVSYAADRQELQLTSTETGTFRISSLTGQTMTRVAVSRGGQAAVSTQGWAKGLYIVVDEHSGRTQRAIVR